MSKNRLSIRSAIGISMLASALVFHLPDVAMSVEVTNGKVTAVSGLVEIRKNATTDWVPLAPGQEIKPGDMLVAGIDGRASIEYPNNKTDIQPLTNLLIGRTVEREKEYVNEFFLKVGTITSDVKHVGGKSNRFRVMTPSSVAGIRGTIAEVSFSPGLGTNAKIDRGLGFVAPAEPAALPASIQMFFDVGPEAERARAGDPASAEKPGPAELEKKAFAALAEWVSDFERAVEKEQAAVIEREIVPGLISQSVDVGRGQSVLVNDQSKTDGATGGASSRSVVNGSDAGSSYFGLFDPNLASDPNFAQAVQSNVGRFDSLDRDAGVLASVSPYQLASGPELLSDPVVLVPEPTPEVVSDPEPASDPVVSDPDPIPDPVVSDPDPIPDPVVSVPDPIPDPVVSDPDPIPDPVVTDPDPVPDPVVTDPDPGVPGSDDDGDGHDNDHGNGHDNDHGDDNDDDHGDDHDNDHGDNQDDHGDDHDNDHGNEHHDDNGNGNGNSNGNGNGNGNNNNGHGD